MFVILAMPSVKMVISLAILLYKCFHNTPLIKLLRDAPELF